jgi:hypothetical protein
VGAIDRFLVGLGRHVTYSDGLYWIYAIVVIAIGTSLALVTGLWGLAGLFLAVVSFFSLFCRKRYERTLASH